MGMFRRIRSALCELTGGHYNDVLPAWAGEGRARFLRLHCKRCGKLSRYYDVPLRSEYPGAYEVEP